MTRLNRAMWVEQREADALAVLEVFRNARDDGEMDIAEEAGEELIKLVARIRDGLERTTFLDEYLTCLLSSLTERFAPPRATSVMSESSNFFSL